MSVSYKIILVYVYLVDATINRTMARLVFERAACLFGYGSFAAFPGKSTIWQPYDGWKFHGLGMLHFCRRRDRAVWIPVPYRWLQASLHS